jgi:hypothetical protein
LETLSPLAKQSRFAALFPGGILNLKTTEFREGPHIEDLVKEK